MGFVGALRRDKGLDELLLAFQSLMSEIKNLRLLLVGDKDLYGTVSPRLRTWAEHCSQIVFEHPTSEIPKLIAAMDIFVFPSHREGFGSVVIEAEAMGVPVIVSDVPGPVDAMQPEQTGLVVRVRDWRAVAKAISELALNPGRIELMGKTALKYVRENYEQQELMRRFSEDKEELIATSNRESSR